jgi:anti-anti-sigma factor
VTEQRAALFRVTTAATAEELRLICSGELDLSSMSQLEDAVSAALEIAPRRLVIDMEQVGFIDSTGVRVVWNSVQRCAGRSIPIAVLPSEPVGKLFKLLQLELPTAKQS